MRRTKADSEARRRILDAADRLFYAEGVRGVGVDRVIAESGVAKMTLYGHFRSKDELIVETLRHREARFSEWFGAAIGRRVDAGEDGPGALFGALREWLESPGFRGCAFINAAVELADPGHPGAAYAREQKARFRALLDGLIAGAIGPEAAAEQGAAVALLIEGAIVTAVIQGSPEPAEVARRAAARLLGG